jgi:hypothetical protein
MKKVKLTIKKVEVHAKPRKLFGDGKPKELPPEKSPKDYYNRQGVGYTEPHSYGWTSIEVLPFLKKTPWNQRALNYVYALRPSCKG